MELSRVEDEAVNYARAGSYSRADGPRQDESGSSLRVKFIGTFMEDQRSPPHTWPAISTSVEMKSGIFATEERTTDSMGDH